MDKTNSCIPGSNGGHHWFLRFVDHRETYGPHIMQSFISMISPFQTIVDIGAGTGRDLNIAKTVCPDAKTIAIDASTEYAEHLSGIADEVKDIDIERDKFPFPGESIDLFMANQVLEHTKEVFWIIHEISRSLKIGGHFIMGVPNIASFHNRILLLFGIHPTQAKLNSGHVRVFSKKDTLNFFKECSPGGYKLSAFAGSQFYPFPKRASRVMTKIRPNMSFSIFFMFKKLSTYKNEFIQFPNKAGLDTNFYLGGKQSSNKYLKLQ